MEKIGEKKSKLERALGSVKKRFGEESIMTMTEKSLIKIDVIPTGSLGLDCILGIGGMPRGRICEIYGREASGKTTLALHIVAEAQKVGDVCAFIDAEHALDAKYSKAIGVDMDSLLISQPNGGEEALDIVETLIEGGDVGVIVIDSVAALTPNAEIEGEMADMQMALQARMMSKAMRKFTAPAYKKNVMVLFINQVRVNIGGYGLAETTAGGKALKFYSSIRIETKKTSTLKTGDRAIGARVKVRVVKNKLASPFKDTEFDIIFGEGISKEGEILLLGEKLKVIEKSGANYTYNKRVQMVYKTQNVGLTSTPFVPEQTKTKIEEIKLGYGYEKSKVFLKDNSKIAMQIVKDIQNCENT